ncbi:hypothetical protein cypCar_00015757 [Cyprinus carpio]|nr:hypothetical protein cypCar_00015757 [Cyprinus carpio]
MLKQRHGRPTDRGFRDSLCGRDMRLRKRTTEEHAQYTQPESSEGLTAVEEELLGLASTLGSQQATVNQLELDLQNEEGLANTGQRYVNFYDFKYKKERDKDHKLLNMDAIVSHLSSLFKPKYTGVYRLDGEGFASVPLLIKHLHSSHQAVTKRTDILLKRPIIKVYQFSKRNVWRQQSSVVSVNGALDSSGGPEEASG